MPISSIRNRRPGKKPLYATSTDATLQYSINTPITPLSPITASRGVPFINLEGGEYYEYFVHTSGDPLPTGITINTTTGVISGTPTVSTVVSESQFSTTSYIAARDSRGFVAYKKSVITFIITVPFVATTSGNTYLTGFIGQTTFNNLIYDSVTGGRPPYVYYIVNGALPNGMSINQSTGRIIGVPTSVKRTYTDQSQTSVIPLTPAVSIRVRDFYNTQSVLTADFHFNIEETVTATASPNVAIVGPLPINIYFNSFTSVTAGVPPYTYFIPSSQSGSYPTGVTVNSVTGVISGTYTGLSTQIIDGEVVETYIPYVGTLKVGVQDSVGNLASTVSEVDINAYVVFEVGLATPGQNSITKLATKSFSFKPLIGSNGVKPYVYRLIDYVYTDGANNTATLTELPVGASIVPADGTLNVASGGIPAGVYKLHYGAHDNTGYEAQNIPEITLSIRDSVVGIPLLTTNTFKMYVNQSSILDTFTDVITAELGTPPYSYVAAPGLPAGMSFATVPDVYYGNTKYQIKGPITAPNKTTVVVSVTDSLGSVAPETVTIDFNVKKHISSSNDIKEIVAFVGDEIEPILVFDTISDGFMPYSVIRNSGTLRPELELINTGYDSDLPLDPANGYTYYNSTSDTYTTEKHIKLWANNWGYDPVHGKTLGTNKTWLYSGSSTITYLVQDVNREFSSNMSSLTFNIYDKLTWTSQYYMVTGVANVDEINITPIVPLNGVPPYKINAVKSKINPATGVLETLPSIGLTLTAPNIISGKANRAFTGTLYYYVTDSAKGRTDDVAVDFNIVDPITATTISAIREVMCVVGSNVYEYKAGSITEVTTELNIPFYTNVQYGKPPYTFFESDVSGNSIASKLPRNFYIDGNTGVMTGYATSTLPLARTAIYCCVSDTIPMKATASKIFLTVHDELTVVSVDNSQAFTNIDGSAPSSYMSWFTNSPMQGFMLVRGVNGSGRYLYSVEPIGSTTMEMFQQYLKINSTSGIVSLSNDPVTGTARTMVSNVFEVHFRVNVTDVFTGVTIGSNETFILQTIAEFKVTVLIESSMLEVSSAVSSDVISVTGGSGSYEVISIIPSLPLGLALSSTGTLSGTPLVVAQMATFFIRIGDTVYNASTQVALNLMIINKVANIYLPSSNAKTVGLDDVSTAANLSRAILAYTPVTVNIYVNGNITSALASRAALTIEMAGLAGSSKINLIMNSSIVGAGGAGGNASTIESSRNGKNGGPGLKLLTGAIPVNILPGTGGMIGGGGGGGGAGGTMWLSYSTAKAFRYLQRQSIPVIWYQYSDGTYQTSIQFDLTEYMYVFDSTYRELYVSLRDQYDDPSPHPYPTPFNIVYRYSPDYDNFFPAPTPSNQQSTGSLQVYTVAGASGGAGAGAGGSVTGANGGTSPNGGSHIIPSITDPTAQDFIDAGFPNNLSVASLDTRVTLDIGGKSGSGGDGTGPGAGLGGVDKPVDGNTLWGCVGGGGGGISGWGGDGDACFDAPANGATIIPGGVGGQGGPAIDATNITASLTIENPSTVYGDINY